MINSPLRRRRSIFTIAVLIFFSQLAMAANEYPDPSISDHIESSCKICGASGDQSRDVSFDETATYFSPGATLLDQNETDPDAAYVSRPNNPERPDGPGEGEVNERLSYVTKAYNPGKGEMTITFEYTTGNGDLEQKYFYHVKSDQEVRSYYSWHNCGQYTVRARAKDEETGETSGWSSIRPVSIYSIPETPLRPSGPIRIKLNQWQEFRTTTKDACSISQSKIKYLFDWGDGNNERTKGYTKSGQPAKLLHYWKQPGYYNIRVQAINFWGKESRWSPSLRIYVYR